MVVKRRLLQLLFVLGLLLTVATGALWVRSLWVVDSFRLQRGWVEPGNLAFYDCIIVETSPSSFVYSRSRLRAFPPLSVKVSPVSRQWHITHNTQQTLPRAAVGGPSRMWWERLGFFRRARTRQNWEAVGVPSWLVVGA